MDSRVVATRPHRGRSEASWSRRRESTADADVDTRPIRGHDHELVDPPDEGESGRGGEVIAYSAASRQRAGDGLADHDFAAFGDVATFKQNVDALIRDIRGSSRRCVAAARPVWPATKSCSVCRRCARPLA